MRWPLGISLIFFGAVLTSSASSVKLLISRFESGLTLELGALGVAFALLGWILALPLGVLTGLSWSEGQWKTRERKALRLISEFLNLPWLPIAMLSWGTLQSRESEFWQSRLPGFVFWVFWVATWGRLTLKSSRLFSKFPSSQREAWQALGVSPWQIALWGVWRESRQEMIGVCVRTGLRLGLEFVFWLVLLLLVPSVWIQVGGTS